MSDIVIKRKEAKAVTFTIKDNAGAVIDVSDPTTVEFMAKDKVGGTTVISKANSDFDKTNAANGEVTIPFTAADTATVGTYIGELKITFSANSIDKSDFINLIIKDSITE